MAKSASFIGVSSFEWKIANALSVTNLESDEFMFHESRWRLCLSSDGTYINVHLNKLDPEKLIGRYTVRAFAKDRSKKPLGVRECVWDVPDLATEEIWWISKDELENQGDTYLTDGNLTFVVVFKFIITPEKNAADEKESHKSSQTSVSTDTVACFENLCIDLHQLLDDGARSDVTLKCGKRSFPAHKLILSARSEVFSAMFRADMIASRSGVVQITDLDASVLDQLIHYIYSGKISDLSMDNAPALCVAADKYGIEFLKNTCLKFIEENLTWENACKMLDFADKHGYRNLKDHVMHFIMSLELLRSEYIWNKFLEEHPKLATEVLHHAYAAKCASNAHDASSAHVQTSM